MTEQQIKNIHVQLDLILRYFENVAIELAEVISDIARSCYECGKNPMNNFCYFGYCLLADLGAEAWLKEKKK